MATAMATAAGTAAEVAVLSAVLSAATAAEQMQTLRVAVRRCPLLSCQLDGYSGVGCSV